MAVSSEYLLEKQPHTEEVNPGVYLTGQVVVFLMMRLETVSSLGWILKIPDTKDDDGFLHMQDTDSVLHHLSDSTRRLWTPVISPGRAASSGFKSTPQCIYFCHLDIIWVNTPSKLLPYGLGSPLSRRRRSTKRCECANTADKICSNFCHKSSEDPKDDVVSPSIESTNTNGNKLLTSLRSVVNSNMAIANTILSSKENPAGVNRLKSRTRR
ncbi:hypothetical protein PFLUV_G00152430 [Scomber scombrus]|uniref:Endothelin-like toxin domain-containing protein n=1 Tax=Scomber scombrus TaxID=13677 RepID=A0AAV1PVG9_SCOSC